MAVFKLVRDGYKEYDALYKLVKYVLDADKMPSRCFGGNGINLYRPADSMYRVKNVFDKKSLKWYYQSRPWKRPALRFSKTKNIL